MGWWSQRRPFCRRIVSKKGKEDEEKRRIQTGLKKKQSVTPGTGPQKALMMREGRNPPPLRRRCLRLTGSSLTKKKNSRFIGGRQTKVWRGGVGHDTSTRMTTGN